MSDTGDPAVESTVFVGGLPYEVDDLELMDVFSAFREVSFAVIVRQRSQPSKSRGFGYVTFVDPDAVGELVELYATAEPSSLPTADWPSVTVRPALRHRVGAILVPKVRKPMKWLCPGVLLMKRFLGRAEQQDVVDRISSGHSLFFTPTFDAAVAEDELCTQRHAHLEMFCFGRRWDPATHVYAAAADEGLPIPDELQAIVRRALAYVAEKAAGSFAHMEPDVCIVNRYTQGGSLGLHQDKDESAESIAAGKPVVSLSLGAAADFVLTTDPSDPTKQVHVKLCSGDLLIFGGPARLIHHGVTRILIKSTPDFLVLPQPARINLTFRET